MVLAGVCVAFPLFACNPQDPRAVLQTTPEPAPTNSAPPQLKLPDEHVDISRIIGASKQGIHRLWGAPSDRSENHESFQRREYGVAITYDAERAVWASFTDLDVASDAPRSLVWVNLSPALELAPAREARDVLEGKVVIAALPCLVSLSKHALVVQTARFEAVDRRRAYASVLQTTMRAQDLDLSVHALGKEATTLRVVWPFCSQAVVDKTNTSDVVDLGFTRIECDARIGGVGYTYAIGK